MAKQNKCKGLSKGKMSAHTLTTLSALMLDFDMPIYLIYPQLTVLVNQGERVHFWGYNSATFKLPPVEIVSS